MESEVMRVRERGCWRGRGAGRTTGRVFSEVRRTMLESRNLFRKGGF